MNARKMVVKNGSIVKVTDRKVDNFRYVVVRRSCNMVIFVQKLLYIDAHKTLLGLDAIA